MIELRALGVTTLDLYVPWNWHEVADGKFDFDGHTNPRRNLREVLRLGRELGQNGRLEWLPTRGSAWAGPCLSPPMRAQNPARTPRPGART